MPPVAQDDAVPADFLQIPAVDDAAEVNADKVFIQLFQHIIHPPIRKHPNLTLVLAASDTEDILDAWKVESAAFLRGKRNPARLASVVRDVRRSGKKPQTQTPLHH